MSVIYHAETVGSLLRPPRLLDLWAKGESERVAEAELQSAEDDAVDSCIELQQRIGLGVITDGEIRRHGWAAMTRELPGLELREGTRSYPASVHVGESNARIFRGPGLTVVRPIDSHRLADPMREFGYLVAHASSPTKYTLPAPSYYRRFWMDGISECAYPTCEDFLADVRDWTRAAVDVLVDGGCRYVQLDAPNYGSLCDGDNREFHRAAGHEVDAQVEFDARLDSSVFEGLGVTRALHVCRGNWLESTWSRGGYAVIAEQLFPNLDMDVVLLEYDSERAGDLEPIRFIKPETTVVLGLVTTKSAVMEPIEALRGRIAEATKWHAHEALAISTQCGFSSSSSNNLASVEEEERKLALVRDVAETEWGGE